MTETVRKSPMLFVKLYGAQLFSSSLWSEAPATRLVFLWFVCQADEDGVVQRCGVAAVARLANVTVEDAEQAIAVLEAPDPDSRSGDEEGRRLIRLPNGDWRVVNAVKYRSFRTHKQIKDAERQARSRATRSTARSSRKSRRRREVESFDSMLDNLAPDHVYDKDEP